jgi:hypothetical protein
MARRELFKAAGGVHFCPLADVVAEVSEVGF